MRLAIIGSKAFAPLELVKTFVDTVPDDTILVLTGMPGPSRIAEEATRGREMPRPDMFSIPRGTHPEDKFKYFCTQRNGKLVEASDVVMVFSDGVDPNSREIIDMTIAAGKPVFIVGNDAPEDFVKSQFQFVDAAYQMYKKLVEVALVP